MLSVFLQQKKRSMLGFQSTTVPLTEGGLSVVVPGCTLHYVENVPMRTLILRAVFLAIAIITSVNKTKWAGYGGKYPRCLSKILILKMTLEIRIPGVLSHSLQLSLLTLSAFKRGNSLFKERFKANQECKGILKN